MKSTPVEEAAGSSQASQSPYRNHVQATILPWLKKLRFRKCLFGGVREEDVWKKMEELNALYEAALVAEQARYDALLQAQQKAGEEHSQK